MRPELIVPLLLLLLLAVLLVRREQQKKAAAVPVPVPASPAAAPGSERLADAGEEPLFTIQVWELGVVLLGLVLLLAHVALGVLPFPLGPLVALAGVLAVVLRTRRAAAAAAADV